MTRGETLESARRRLVAGDLDEAVRLCDRVLAEAPEDARANLYKGAALLVRCGPGFLEKAGREALAAMREGRAAGPAEGASSGPHAPRGGEGRKTMAPSEGASLIAGQYTLLRQIGEGGMGLVYEGRDARLGRAVAIKRMRPEIKVSARERRRFMEEARTAANLHHDYIVEIYNIVEEADEVYLVFEFLPGPTLESLLDRDGKAPFDRARPWLKSACEALSFAHARGVVHRDIKPANIMLSAAGNAKVMDFGIAARGHATMSRLTGVQTPGTAAFMAPEQHMGRFDARSDVFALGVTAYELLSGDLPFPGPDFCLQKERMSFKPLAETEPSVPRPASDAVGKCLESDPAKRFQTIAEFGRALGL